MTRAILALLMLIVGGCARGEDESVADTQSTVPSAAEATVGDTSVPMSPADKSAGEDAVPVGSGTTPRRPPVGSGESKVPTTPDTTSKTTSPRPGMRPGARDREPWQVPPPDSTDSARTKTTPPED
jgi:hypothetical protein